jgi:hypothetical protein
MPARPADRKRGHAETMARKTYGLTRNVQL